MTCESLGCQAAWFKKEKRIHAAKSGPAIRTQAQDVIRHHGWTWAVSCSAPGTLVSWPGQPSCSAG
ncbi:MAG: hypothetical protein CSA33_03755 [Desulfobulbus propionicus]|nr:MAG: hypothetical protein CSA33_03755 [Desulfobulbus propionicus]